MTERFEIRTLPYGVEDGLDYVTTGSNKYNGRNIEHQEIVADNNALMLVKLERALAASKIPNIKKLTKKERDGFAKFLTAQYMHESVFGTKVTGTHNYGGNKASKEQIKAGKATGVTTTETVDGISVTIDNEGFLNFKSVDDWVLHQIAYMDRRFPDFYKAKTFEQAILALQNKEDKAVYATDLLQRNNDLNIFEKDISKNQYGIKIANYFGHDIIRPNQEQYSDEDKDFVKKQKGFLQPDPRFDMDIDVTYNMVNGERQKTETYLLSKSGRNGKLRSIPGISRGQYLNTNQVETLRKGGVKLESKVKKQKENSNNNLNKTFADDYIPTFDFVQYGVSQAEIIGGSFGGASYGSMDTTKTKGK